LITDIDTLPRDSRNCMWLAFTDPACARRRRNSPDSADRHEVAVQQQKQKRFRNAQVGLLKFDVNVTWLSPRLGARMMVYTPADAQTSARLNELAALSG
jgi:hypothetical protein